MQTQKFNVIKPSLVELYNNVANVHELFLNNKKAGLITMVDLRIKEVTLVDFFQALNFFKKQAKCDLREIRDPQTKELLAYCFHYVPCLSDSFQVMVVTEVLHDFRSNKIVIEN